MIEDSLKCNIFCLPLEIVFRTKATKHCNKSAHFKHNNLEEVQWLMTIFTSANKWESFEDLLWYSTWTKSTLGDKKVSNLLSLHKKDNLFYYLTYKHIVVNLIYIKRLDLIHQYIYNIYKYMYDNSKMSSKEFSQYSRNVLINGKPY